MRYGTGGGGGGECLNRRSTHGLRGRQIHWFVGLSTQVRGLDASIAEGDTVAVYIDVRGVTLKGQTAEYVPGQGPSIPPCSSATHPAYPLPRRVRACVHRPLLSRGSGERPVSRPGGGRHAGAGGRGSACSWATARRAWTAARASPGLAFYSILTDSSHPIPASCCLGYGLWCGMRRAALQKWP